MDKLEIRADIGRVLQGALRIHRDAVVLRKALGRILPLLDANRFADAYDDGAQAYDRTAYLEESDD